MYPRVKVREQTEVNHFSPSSDRGSGPSLFLRVLESLSSQDGPLSGENQNNSPVPNSITKVGKACDSASGTGCVSVKNDTVTGKNMKQNARIRSVLRPRAVLSSPDNDGVIGNINRLEIVRSSPEKKLNSEWKMLGKARAIPIRIPTKATTPAKEGKAPVSDKGLPQKKTPGRLVQTHRER